MHQYAHLSPQSSLRAARRTASSWSPGEDVKLLALIAEHGEQDWPMIALTQLPNEVMKVMIDLRNQFREEKNFQGADMIRDRLAEAGIQLKDSREGTNWE